MMMSFDEEYREEHDECRHEIESLTAKVKHYESIESEMLMIGVERAKDEYESKLIALQLDNRRLREALEEYAKPTASLYACNEGANKALSRPTDTAEADALVALRDEARKWASLIWSIAKPLNCLPSCFSDDNGHLVTAAQEMRGQLDAARAVIEEAEKALKTSADMFHTYAVLHGMKEQTPENVEKVERNLEMAKVCGQSIDRIAEWKESGK